MEASAQLLEEVAAALRRPLTDVETTDVAHLEVGARALVRGHLRQDPPPDAAATVDHVVARMVVRAVARAGTDAVGLSSQTAQAGAFQITQGFLTDAQGGGVWLTQQDKIMLSPWRATMASVPLVSERT